MKKKKKNQIPNILKTRPTLVHKPHPPKNVVSQFHQLSTKEWNVRDLKLAPLIFLLFGHKLIKFRHQPIPPPKKVEVLK